MPTFKPFPPETVIPPPPRFKDPASLSSPGLIYTDHIHLNLDIDHTACELRGSATYTFRILDPSCTSIVLDVRAISISSITHSSGIPLTYTLNEHATPIGGSLTIQRPSQEQDTVHLSIHYSTSGTGGSSGMGGACDWLRDSQTVDRTAPYVFTQCQAIHARSIVPCQDTPAVKATYSAVMTVCEPYKHLTVVMSAQQVQRAVDDPEESFRFECSVPIPSYLIAFACGNLEARELSPRCRVWSEPSVVDSAAWEFADVEKMLSTAERVAGPYVWGRYDLLVLPASFPYGGMENPMLTFVTPTLLAGDRSLVSVVVHEIAHSWAGNLVSCQDCRHFWVNEGFTVKLERRILRELYGSGREGLDAIAGRQSLDRFIKGVGKEHKYTSLVTKLEDGEDPDDYFSCVQYEKGYNFLLYLEQCVEEQGEGEFHDFLKDYFAKFRYQSITGADFIDMFCAAFPKATSGIDFDEWLHGVGGCPKVAAVDTSLVEEASSLASEWLEACERVSECNDDEAKKKLRDEFGDKGKEVKKWGSKQMLCLLTELNAKCEEGNGGWDARGANVMEEVLELNRVENSEIRFAWCRLGLRGEYEGVLENVEQILRSQGRMKFVRPLFNDLHEKYPKGDFAKQLFSNVRDGYHSIAVKMIERDLGIGKVV